RRLILAGNIPVGHEAFFDEKIRPFLHPGRIEYVGPVDEAQKLPLYQHATALLFPIQWKEPFGIVMAESLACGTPVIALNNGAAPEVIKQGVNGLICASIPEVETAIGRIEEISRDACRQIAVARFSLETVSSAYLQILQQLDHG
ncbi:MAG: glycosyltransferase, partial [Saprospiraceae bacterium]